MPKLLRGNIGVQHRRQPVALGLAQRIRRRGLPAAAQSEKKRDRAYRKQEGRRAPEEGGFRVEWRFQQDEISIAPHQEIAHLRVAVARLQTFANQ